MKKIFCLFLLFGLMGCQTAEELFRSSSETHRLTMNKWIGLHTDNLLMQKGRPVATYNLQSGNHVWEYFTFNEYTTGGEPVKSEITEEPDSFYSFDKPESSKTTNIVLQSHTPIVNHRDTCRARFVVDNYNIIVSWTTEGKSCHHDWKVVPTY